MRIRQQRIEKRGTWRINVIYSLFLILIFSILIVNPRLIPGVEGTGFCNAAPQSISTDSISLIYNSVDASNFPRIVSIVRVWNNASGFVIGKLDENNFEVREDGVRELPIIVEELTADDVGINVVLVIDRSGSMFGQPVDDAKAAATTFVGLMQSNDQSAVVSFNRRPYTDYPLSGNKDSLTAAISRIESIKNSGTAIFDALIHASDLLTNVWKNPAIILLTDGADHNSRYTYQDALNVLLPMEVPVFTIGLGLDRNSPEEDILIDLANRTSGMYFYSPTSSDLEEIYRAISMLLHHRYRITYTTHNPAKDGTLRHVRIDVNVHGNTSSDTASYRAPYEPVFEVKPNPFTPNDDGFNDKVEFREGETNPPNWVITIMERSGQLIKRLTNGEKSWDGKDDAGQLMLPGCYLYMVSDGGRVIHRGLIQLIR